VADERGGEHAEEELVAQVARGTLTAQGAAQLERHLVECSTCVAELEAMRVFQVSVAPLPEDEVLDQVAVEGALGRLGDEDRLGAAGRNRADEALDRLAVDRAMAVLGEQDARQRRRRWRGAGLAVFGAAAAAAILVVTSAHRAPVMDTAVGPSRPLVLADGSEVIPDVPATPIQIREQTAARTVVRLSSGAARFRVKHDARRLFRVDAGPIEIEDLGTVFRVAHQPDGQVRVVVSEGRVAVLSTSSGARVELGAGEERVFSTAAPAARAELARSTGQTAGTAPTAQTVFGGGAPVEEPAVTAPLLAPAAVVPASPSGAAPPLARTQPRPHLEGDPAELLAAADVARRSRDPRAAVGPLRRLVQRHPKDPRAPSAAFTLGWVLLTDLGRPREAAGAFADAERLAPRGALAEDAAARVAEAWQSAGESRRASEAARRYEQLYPMGRYVGLMDGLIGKHHGRN